MIDILTGAVGCSVNPENVPAGRIEQWLPISPGSTFYQARYSEVWSWIGTHQAFPDTCSCTLQIDNGAGISWAITLAPGTSVTRSHLTTFSPVGALPLSLAKMADTATVTVGGSNGYTVLVDNRNNFAVPVVSVADTLPAGFVYQPGSTSGALTIDPIISGRTLTWTTTITVPALGASTFHFGVLVATATGTYFNNVAASAVGSISVSPTGDTAPVYVVLGARPDAGVADSGALDTGVEADAGVVVVMDAGAELDAGEVDGGVEDSGEGEGDGSATDAGEVATDGGVVEADGAVAADASEERDGGGEPADAELTSDDAAGPGPMDGAVAASDATGGARDTGGVAAADGSTIRDDTGTGLGEDSGCSCGAMRGPDAAPWAIVLLALGVMRRRRSSRASSGG